MAGESAFSKITRGLGKSFGTMGSKIATSLDNGNNGIQFKNTSAGRAGYGTKNAKPFYDTSYDAVQNPNPFLNAVSALSFPDVPANALNDVVHGAGYNRANYVGSNTASVKQKPQEQPVQPIPPKNTPPTADSKRKDIGKDIGKDSRYTSKDKRTDQSTQSAIGSADKSKKTAFDMGWGTVDDIKKFQQDNGLKVDGIVGKDTRAALAAKYGLNDLGVTDSAMNNAVAEDYNYSGVPAGGDVYTGQSNMGNYSGQSNVGGSAFGNLFSSWGDGTWVNPRGYTHEQMKNLTPEQMIALKDAKSPLESAFGMAGSAGQFLGGLGGLYGQYQNAKLEKDKMNIAKQQQRAIDANTSAFARAAGGTYTPTGV